MPPPSESSQFTPYEPLPSSGSRPHSAADLNSYFDQPVPAPHHMSGGYPAPNIPYRPSMEAPEMQQAGASPFLTPSRSSNGYMSPADAAYRTDTAGLGIKDEARHSQVSMTGLGSTPPEQKSTWLQNEVKHQKRNRILFISTCLVIVAIIIAAIVLGVYFGTKNKNNNSSSNSASNDSSVHTSTAGAVEQDPNDPSNFVKDPNLKNSFYGVAYTMMDALYPDCHQGLPSTIEDMQLISQITTRIRLYGADCNQTSLVLEAIKQTKTNIKVFPAIYIVDGDDVAYERQKTALKESLETYGTDNVLGITVGNEFMLNYIIAHNAQDASGSVGLAASALLKEKITDIREMLKEMNIDLPVGTADAGSYFNDDLLGAVDFGMSNVHAWFAQTTIGDASSWTKTFFQETNVDVANGLPNKPQMYIAEAGWPTHSSTTADQTNGAAEASVANLQKFMDDFVCSSNTEGIKYFYFEFTDIPWKAEKFPGIEGFWGLFDSNKKLKAVTLPDCTHD